MNPIQHDIALDAKTTLRIGGKARHFGRARSAKEIEELAAWAATNELPVLILGNGSNLLISDAGWPGLVIEVGGGFKSIVWDANCACCDGGASLHALVAQSVERNLSGMQFLGGIPGTVGGALVMNAGAFGRHISDCLEWVDVLEVGNGLRKRFKRSDIGFGYRTSSLKKADVLVVQAQFRLHENASDALRDQYSQTLQKRKERQPLDKPNCGSVFKRPEGNYAGALIEKSGLKGMRIGNAMVSEKHANFIVNTGGATAEDVRRLIAHIQQRVHELHGVLLEPEVVFAGEFAAPLYEPE